MENKSNRKISVIIPVYNEAQSLDELYHEIVESIHHCFDEGFANNYELWFIDDGSTDNSKQIIYELSTNDLNVHLISLKEHSGKSVALDEGFQNISGDIVFTIDSDLQDDPSEFIHLIHQLDEGYDLVVGWRRQRHDGFIKKLSSNLYNYLYSSFLGIPIHDHDCGLKCFRYEATQNLNLSRGLHRYLPTLVQWNEFKVTEIPVNHRQRKYGKSKYNSYRYFECIKDFFFVKKIVKKNKGN